ncbi:MAG: YgiQ family radical SAM protein, partial [Clostridiales bacterium]|nr:YgiQ family radical SAM protein [Clostridiales bacterium]
LDPMSMQPVHVPDEREKRWQRALLQPTAPRNRRLVVEALTAAGRTDLLKYPGGAFAIQDQPAEKAPRGGTRHEHSDQRQGTVRQAARPNRRGR